ncbi:hypothetical protein AYI69_g7533 [Smittium culicis]|uniref:Rrn7/TAF1B N-terminal cyclin domain-containing protein n=1 Tax=Smittium culicis TaxID=133412 RepID=A0A1R1XR88_9FUNG|nr:hypothetical protein AYI69_g7533 [Smittium culicis]
MSTAFDSVPKKRKRKPCEICGLKKWRKNDIGRLECPLGHEYVGFVEEELDYVEGQIYKRKLTKKTKKSRIIHRFYSDRGDYLFIKCLQILLQTQVAKLIKEFGAPEELEEVAKELWFLRLSDLKIIRDYDDDLEIHGNLANEISSSENESEDDSHIQKTTSDLKFNEMDILNEISQSARLKKISRYDETDDEDQIDLENRYKILDEEAKLKESMTSQKSKKRKNNTSGFETDSDSAQAFHYNKHSYRYGNSSGNEADNNSEDLISDTYNSDTSINSNSKAHIPLENNSKIKFRNNPNSEKLVAASVIVVLKLLYGLDGVYRNRLDSQHYLDIYGDNRTRSPTINELLDFIRSDFYMQLIPSRFLCLTVNDKVMLNRYSENLDRLLLLEGVSFLVKARKKFANHLNSTFAELRYYLENDNCIDNNSSSINDFLQKYLNENWSSFGNSKNSKGHESYHEVGIDDVDKNIYNFNNIGNSGDSGMCFDSAYCFSSGIAQKPLSEFDSLLLNRNLNEQGNTLEKSIPTNNKNSLNNFELNSSYPFSPYIKIFDILKTIDINNYKKSGFKHENTPDQGLAESQHMSEVNGIFDQSLKMDEISTIEDSQENMTQLGTNMFVDINSFEQPSKVPETQIYNSSISYIQGSQDTSEIIDGIKGSDFFEMVESYYNAVKNDYPPKLPQLEYYFRDYDSILNGLIKSSFHQHLGIPLLTEAQKSMFLTSEEVSINLKIDSDDSKKMINRQNLIVDLDPPPNQQTKNLMFSGDMIPVYLMNSKENGITMGDFPSDYSNLLIYMADLCGLDEIELHEQVTNIEINLLKNQIEMRLRISGPANARSYIVGLDNLDDISGKNKTENISIDNNARVEDIENKVNGEDDIYSSKMDIVDINDEELAGRSYIKKRVTKGILMENKKDFFRSIEKQLSSSSKFISDADDKSPKNIDQIDNSNDNSNNQNSNLISDFSLLNINDYEQYPVIKLELNIDESSICDRKYIKSAFYDAEL